MERSIRLRLNTDEPYEDDMYHFLKEKCSSRKCKPFLMRGVELAAYDEQHDYEALARLLPGFVAYIQAQTAASPSSQFETMMRGIVQDAIGGNSLPTTPAALPALPELEPLAIEDEPEIALTDDFDDFLDFEV